MATVLQKMYVEARVNGRRGHGAALRHLERETGLDRGTIARCLHRARRADERDARGN